MSISICYNGAALYISMALCKTAVTPLLTHWSYRSFVLSHRHIHGFSDCRHIYVDEIGPFHDSDVMMSAMASQITSVSIVYSTADQRKHQSSASLAFWRGIHRSAVISRTRASNAENDVIMSPCFCPQRVVPNGTSGQLPLLGPHAIMLAHNLILSCPLGLQFCRGRQWWGILKIC